MLSPDISSKTSIALMLLALTVLGTGKQLSITSGFFKKSVKGERLSDCLISEKIVLHLIECGQWCLNLSCQSFNYGEKESSQRLYACQLNYCTKKDHLVSVDRKFEYYEMVPQLTECERCSEPSFSVLFPRHSIEDYVESFLGRLKIDSVMVCSFCDIKLTFENCIKTTPLERASQNHIVLRAGNTYPFSAEGVKRKSWLFDAKKTESGSLKICRRICLLTHLLT
ncbi:Hypothetical predicted protein, partial [Paramuricea clavata]